MSDRTDISIAKMIMGNNFIGPDELSELEGMPLDVRVSVTTVPFSREILFKKKSEYMLILGVNKTKQGDLVTIRKMIEMFGMNPENREPCFYNQDWYMHEAFIDEPIVNDWFLIRKCLFKESRAVQPSDLIMQYAIPSAIKCCYSFFVSWLAKGIKLWLYDYVWCSDVDHNGDRIYVGKYYDVDGINKNGFSIHRHLALRDCYGCVDCELTL